jgi:hypothetical protein
MRTHTAIAFALVAAAAAAAPAVAVTNVIVNGSFEAGLSGWTPVNDALARPIAVLDYNCNCAYPNGAYGEAVMIDTSLSLSPDTVGGKAAYFVDDHAVNQGLTQSNWYAAGVYQVGFSAYLPLNGFRNRYDATFAGQIAGTTIASFTASQGVAQNWVNYSGNVTIANAGFYNTGFVYNSFGGPAKDVVIDRVYAVQTGTVPEPASWAMLIAGFGLVGAMLRRRRGTVVAA